MTSANLEILDATNETDCVDEISRLHHEIFQQAETMLQNIMRIGELLVKQKQKIPHGN